MPGPCKTPLTTAHGKLHIIGKGKSYKKAEEYCRTRYTDGRLVAIHDRQLKNEVLNAISSVKDCNSNITLWNLGLKFNGTEGKWSDGLKYNETLHHEFSGNETLGGCRMSLLHRYDKKFYNYECKKAAGFLCNGTRTRPPPPSTTAPPTTTAPPPTTTAPTGVSVIVIPLNTCAIGLILLLLVLVLYVYRRKQRKHKQTAAKLQDADAQQATTVEYHTEDAAPSLVLHTDDSDPYHTIPDTCVRPSTEYSTIYHLATEGEDDDDGDIAVGEYSTIYDLALDDDDDDVMTTTTETGDVVTQAEGDLVVYAQVASKKDRKEVTSAAGTEVIYAVVMK